MTGTPRCCTRSNSQAKVLCIMPTRLGGTDTPSPWGQRQLELQHSLLFLQCTNCARSSATLPHTISLESQSAVHQYRPTDELTGSESLMLPKLEYNAPNSASPGEPFSDTKSTNQRGGISLTTPLPPWSPAHNPDRGPDPKPCYPPAEEVLSECKSSRSPSGQK